MTDGRLREEFRGLSRQELLGRAYELGHAYEKYSQGCSQCTVAALHRLLNIDDVVVKVATSLCGGAALQIIGSCGALTGGLMVLDYYFGRPVGRLSDKESIQANLDALFSAFEAPQLYADRFVKEHGTTLCGQIQRRLFGRFYWPMDEEENQKFEAAGAHTAKDKCCHVVGNGARWVVEILLDKRVIEP